MIRNLRMFATRTWDLYSNLSTCSRDFPSTIMSRFRFCIPISHHKRDAHVLRKQSDQSVLKKRSTQKQESFLVDKSNALQSRVRSSPIPMSFLQMNQREILTHNQDCKSWRFSPRFMRK